MECTQRLDFELSQTQSEKICPEQIGFLGILGTKYPVKRGPNKIGRDPQTCNIVLNLNSISRQHAVLNVLNGRDFMLMDLDSANKTRINNKSLQAYIPVAISNGDTVQFGEVFGIFRLLEEETDLPCTQAIEVPDTPASHALRLGRFTGADSPGTQAVPDTPTTASHASRLRHATVPESPDVSDKDDSFIMPSQPKPQNKFRGPANNFIKSSSKTISIQPIGTNKIDNVYWNSSKKSNSFILDGSSNSLNDSSHDRDIKDRETDPPNDSTDSIYTAETQLPPKCASIHSQDTQLPKDDDIFDAETQLPKSISPKCNIDEGVYESNTQPPSLQSNTASEDNIFEAETQLPSKNVLEKDESIHEMETQPPFPIHNASTDSIYMAETQLPTVGSPSIYSQETQLPKLNDYVVRDSPKSIYDANTQLPFEEPNVSGRQNADIFDAKTQLSNKDDVAFNLPEADKSNLDSDLNDEKLCQEPNEIDDDIFNAATQQLTVRNFNVSTDLKDNSKSKTANNDNSDEEILFDEVDAHDHIDELNASQPILCGDILPIQDECEDIPLSQSDTITDDDFEIRLEDTKTEEKPAEKDVRANSNASTDCEELDFLPTQKIAENPVNEDEDTDCEEDVTNGKKIGELEEPSKLEIDFSDLPTQVIPEAGPSCRFDELPTQVIPEISVENPNNKINEQNFEDMLTQVIPENNCENATNFEDLPTQLIAEDDTNKSSLQFSEEVVASPFKIPLQTPMKIKKKEIPNKIIDQKSRKSPLAIENDEGNEKYYSATQEIFDDLCSQQISPVDSKTINNNVLKNQASKLGEKKEQTLSEDGKVGSTKVTNFEGEMEISVKKFSRESSGSSDGEEKVNKYVNNLSAKQINTVIGADVTMIKRVPSDPSDVDVTPKKVRPGRFMETLLPDSQEIKTSVSVSTKTEATDSSSESEKESQEQTPIVFRKKKRVKADVKKDLSSKFDVHALPTRIITRMRKPTSKLQESEADNKKRSRNILKPKFLNDSEQDEVDTEIISENITRLKSKHDKKIHNDTSVGGEKIEEVKTDNNTRRSNEENLVTSKLKSDQDDKTKSKNSKNTVVDLTSVDREKPKTRRKNKKSDSNNDIKDKSNDKIKQTDVSKLEDDKHDSNKEISKASKPKSKNNITDNVVDLTTLEEVKPRPRRNLNSKTNKDITENRKKSEEVIVIHTEIDTSKENSQETSKISRSRRKNVQDKITNYTVTKDESSTTMTDESRVSNKRTRVDESLNSTDDKNRTLSTRRGNKDTTNREKSVQEEHQTKRKRGRPPKEDKEKEKVSKDKKEVKDKKDNKRQKTDDKQEVEQPEIRRSRRQKITKSDSQTSRIHEQSAIYSLSSESSADSPKRKRKDVSADPDAPTSKRTRSNTGTVLISSDTSSVCTTVNSNASSLRSTPSRAANTQYVLFTAFPNEDVKVMLEKLGAVVVTDVSACTVVLTLQLRRTFKLLCAVGLGRPIVGPAWVKACHDSGILVDPWQYILCDAASEARFSFSLARTLGGARQYLRGYHVGATRSVLPAAAEMKQIVECSGGVWTDGGSGPAGRWLVVTCPADRAQHQLLRSRGATLVSSELVLAGVLRQSLDLDKYLLH